MTNEHENRRFIIINCEELNLIDFNQVYETSAETVRKSVDETLTFVEYNLPAPEFVQLLQTKSQEYTYEEILEILNGPDWSAPFDDNIINP
jgi:hypothetical protein